MAENRQYSKIARQYAEDVVSGKLVTCQFVKQACQRQLNDLNGCSGWSFSDDYANSVCTFIEGLKHIKGRQWINQTIKLKPWQIFILTTVFGWVNSEGLRRFKTVYIEVPRKNAKSTLSAGVGLFCLASDNEPGAEVYSAATTRDQAKIVFSVAKAMADKDGELREDLGIQTQVHSVYVQDTLSSFKALSREYGGNLDGLNIHCGIIDELHAHKTRDIFDVLETGTGSRAQPLIWMITTAGFNRAGICYEQRHYVKQILNKSVSDDQYFGIIYTIDDDDDWTDRDCWIKANPNWEVSVSQEDIERKANKAMQLSSAQNNFKTKHLNVWVNADTAWMNMVNWDRCADRTLSLDSQTGQKCWIGVDLASKVDIAAVSILFEVGGKVLHFGRYYLPEETIETSSNSQYAGWVHDGHLIATPGAVIDFNIIQNDLREFASRFEIQEIGFDPFQATKFATELIDEGFNMVEVRPTVLNFSEPMKELEALTISDRLRHDGNPVMDWMISNVVCHVDAKDNIYPRKELPDNKIDGVVSTITALSRLLAAVDLYSVYDDEDLLAL